MPSPAAGSAVAGAWTGWMVGKALPLWSGVGYDPRRRLYHERLTFDAAPIAMPHLRLMVQARQIATFCQARLDGLFDASATALACLAEVQARYWRADGQPGWVFALGPDGQPSITVRDLYAHAFMLFAYAWAYRVSGEPSLLGVVAQTVEEIERIFHAPSGGFMDAVPPPDTIRRQNPHMHLLEAYLALFEATEDQRYLDRAGQLVTLACQHFLGPQSGLLLEYFGADWLPCQEFGKNPVEPGHLFEWSWLLGEYMRLSPAARQNPTLHHVAEHFYQTGRQYGVRAHGVCDGILDNGTVVETSTRIWPQTEFVRLLACRRETGGGYMGESELLQNMTRIFFTSYAPGHLQGGWVDRLDAKGRPRVDHMPASSLYHIYGAVKAQLGVG